jgi:ribonuclease D
LYTSTPDYVRTPEELDTALKKLADSPFVAIDTEFLRERTYFPKFCLLQIGHDNYCALIDVLALPSLTPLMDFLNDRSRLKVLHAAHQDLEVLALANGASQGKQIAPIAGPFIDTQVAAAFLDMPAHIGYADLVQRRLNHTLDKGQARTDWSLRPLSAAQLSYAADDVIYLVELYHDLKKTLGQTPRWSWIEEDALQLEDAKLYATEPIDAWQRLRGLEQLQPEQRAAAKALAAWREQRAIHKDRPRSWILTDDALRAIAEQLPATVTGLEAIKGMPAGLVQRRGDELLQLLSDSKAQAANEGPARDFRPTRSQQKKVTNLMDFVRKEGARLHISPERLATRRDIEALVFSGRIGGFGQGWRFHSFGEQLIKMAEKLLALDAADNDQSGSASSEALSTRPA